MEDIAQAADVSSATADNHFPTEHALLAQVYAPVVAPFVARAEQDLDNGMRATPNGRSSRRWRTRSGHCAGSAGAIGR